MWQQCPEESVSVSEVTPLFAYKFAANKKTHNPLQINPTEASAPIDFVKSMSGISYTRILLQPGTAEIFSRSLNDWNWPSYFRIQHEEIWLSCSPDSSVWSSRMERSLLIYLFQLLWLCNRVEGLSLRKLNLTAQIMSDHVLCIEIVLHNQSKTIKISLKLQEIQYLNCRSCDFFW